MHIDELNLVRPSAASWKNGLCPEQPRQVFHVGQTSLHYELLDREDQHEVRFFLLPVDLAENCQARRGRIATHPSMPNGGDFVFWGDQAGDSCVQIAMRGAAFGGGYGCGRTMRNGEDVKRLKPMGQQHACHDGVLWIETRFQHPRGLEIVHRVLAHESWSGVLVSSIVVNDGTEPAVLEHVSSFALGGLSPLAKDDMPDRLELRRVRSAWSGEGRLERMKIEDLHMERSWTGHAITGTRFGQIGSMPVREYFPVVGLADLGTGVAWGASLLWHGSWQIEVLRRDDPISISGGLGDFDMAHWAKELMPGDAFEAPLAWLVVVDEARGEDWLAALEGVHAVIAHPEPQESTTLPVIFNEWCSSWGNPNHDDVVATATVAAELGAEYFVIDDGWAEKRGRGFQFNGDWNVDFKRFPGGLRPTVEALQDLGLKAGIWFEFETCSEGTNAFEATDRNLTRNGFPLQVGNRRFLDFRNPAVLEFLREKVVTPLRDAGFEYLKIDYNDSIGVGVDSVDGKISLGEGLRSHLIEVRGFLRELRESLPSLIVENCSSGGHRLEPGLVGLTSLSSATDAHETLEIPILAANTHHLVPPSKNLIMAVIREKDALRRIEYSLTATFFGRMCLSGDLRGLTAPQLDRIREGISFYRDASTIIHSGQSLQTREIDRSYRYPAGWQMVRRISDDGQRMLLIAHSFERRRGDRPLIGLPAGEWKHSCCYGSPGFDVRGEFVRFDPEEDFCGSAIVLHRA